MYLSGSIESYLDDLAAKKPAPGGGSAAALSAALGAALISMVANYTIGNDKYAEGREAIADIYLKAEKARAVLQDLIDKDVDAYGKLSKGIKAHKKDADKLDELYRTAADVPLEACMITAECIKLCKELVRYGNKNLITDTATATVLLESAFFSAKYNVYINLKYIKDISYVERVHKALSPLEKELPELKEEILELCEEVIAK